MHKLIDATLFKRLLALNLWIKLLIGRQRHRLHLNVLRSHISTTNYWKPVNTITNLPGGLVMEGWKSDEQNRIAWEWRDDWTVTRLLQPLMVSFWFYGAMLHDLWRIELLCRVHYAALIKCHLMDLYGYCSTAPPALPDTIISIEQLRADVTATSEHFLDSFPSHFQR